MSPATVLTPPMSRFLTARKDDFLTQDLINTLPSRISLCQFSDRDAVKALCLVEELAPTTLGVSLQLSEDASIDAIALATVNCVFLITVTCSDASPNASLQRLLQHESYPLAGFGMEQLALLLYRHGSDCRGIDLGTALASDGRETWSPSKSVSQLLDNGVNRHRINEVWYRTNRENACLRAWFNANLAARGINIEHALKVDTRLLNEEQLDVLSRLVVNVVLLTAQKPLEMENKHEGLVKNKYGQLELRNARFKTRVRRSEETSIVIRDKSGSTIYGQATDADGKTTHIAISRGTFRGEVESIHVVGREEPTNAERARDEFILRLLRGQAYLDSRFIDVFWFPSPSIIADVGLAKTSASNSHLEHVQLNESQTMVTNAMVLGTQSVIIAHGPPGTGKTKTISTAVEFWDQRGSPVWVIAQSNVGVKNIAESFFKHDINFKLLVSKEFHFEWHEYLYERLDEVLIRSDDLSGNKDPGAAERLFGGSTVVLCTLSMLSNPMLEDRLIFKLIPMEKLVVDEASQIDVFEFMHLFHKFKELQKICFFGDPKQLPPFGKETAPDLQTVFDLRHLQQHAYFLDTQYRMPVPLGDFISQQFYNSKLKSVHPIQEMSCVAFVDVRRGEEEQKGRSWVNMDEVDVVVNLVRHYYRKLDFCVITPYDSQRSAIAKQLQVEELPWECVYNVDSFQGHEKPYVIVSTVRTERPGFLNSRQRMNVMLTRCQRGMVIVTNKRFLENGGKNTVMGEMMRDWTWRRGQESVWTDPYMIMNRFAELPGFATKETIVTTSSATSVWPPTLSAASMQSLESAMMNIKISAQPPQAKLMQDDFPELPRHERMPPNDSYSNSALYKPMNWLPVLKARKVETAPRAPARAGAYRKEKEEDDFVAPGRKTRK